MVHRHRRQPRAPAPLDLLNDLADIAHREGLWFHVDGAYGAPARLTPQGANLLAGIERADNPAPGPAQAGSSSRMRSARC